MSFANNWVVVPGVLKIIYEQGVGSRQLMENILNCLLLDGSTH